jgi:hypothetical protein
MENTCTQTKIINKNETIQIDAKIQDRFSQELSEPHTSLPMQHIPHNHNTNPEMLARFFLFFLPLTYQDWKESKTQPVHHF